MGINLLKAMGSIFILSIVLLFAVGGLLDYSENNFDGYRSFFQLELYQLGGVKYWILSVLMLFFANGVWFVKLSSIQGRGNLTNEKTMKEIGFNYPVHPIKLFGGNLLMISLLVFGFLLIR